MNSGGQKIESDVGKGRLRWIREENIFEAGRMFILGKIYGWTNYLR